MAAHFDDYPDLLTLKQAAELLGIHPDTARRKVKRGDIPAFRVPGGRKIRIKKSDLLASLVPMEVQGEDDDHGGDCEENRE